MEPFLGQDVTEEDIEEAESELLKRDEKLVAIAPGRLPDQLYALKTQFVVVTDQRILFFGRALFNPTTQSFPLDRIKGVRVRQEFLSTALELDVGGRRESFCQMDEGDSHAIARIIRDQLRASSPSQPSPSQPSIIREKIVEREVVLIRCPYCKAKQPDSATFCSHCGAKL